MPTKNDPLSTDPFFSHDPFGGSDELINSFEIARRAGWLEDHGYKPGDDIRVTWRGSDGGVVSTTMELPDGDWHDSSPHGTWHDYYDELRVFYEDIWADIDDGRGYHGEAKTG